MNTSQALLFGGLVALLEREADGREAGGGRVLGRELRQPHEDQLRHVAEALLRVAPEELCEKLKLKRNVTELWIFL